MASSLLICFGRLAHRRLAIVALLSLVLMNAGLAQTPKLPSSSKAEFHVVAFYSPTAEPDHVQFAEGALKYFSVLAAKSNFTFDSTTDWANLNAAYLKKYQLVIWLTDSPSNPEQRLAFQHYMEGGGAWLGFHCAGYNDKDTNWPWYVDFLGGAVFHINSWPPLPARLVVDVCPGGSRLFPDDSAPQQSLLRIDRLGR